MVAAFERSVRVGIESRRVVAGAEISSRQSRSASTYFLNPCIKHFSEGLFIASPFPIHDDSQRARWLRADIDLRHTALDLIPPRISLNNYDVAISFEQTQRDLSVW